MEYKFIIAIDFEATCWENDPRPKFRKSEIIEFPAVLFNCFTGEILSEFHKLLKPEEKPILSDFCKNLTGITQYQVDSGITLKEAFSAFYSWLQDNVRQYNLVLAHNGRDGAENCIFATWSDCDFTYFLHNECRRKGIEKPKYFNKWMKSNGVFEEKYKKKPSSFEDALNYVGLSFEGRRYSGLAAAKNICRLVHKMAKDGARLCPSRYSYLV